MDVVEDDREPLLVELLGEDARLLLREHEPVAVVVVADVLLVEPRHGAAFPGRAERLLVPVDHEIEPVRIRARDEDDDAVVEDLAGRRVVLRREIVGEFHRHLSRGDLGGVKAARHEEDRARLLEELRLVLGLQAPGVGEQALDLPDAVEVLEVRLGADGGEDHRRAERGFTDLAHLNARTGVELREVVADRLPAGELEVGADLVAEMLARSRRLLLGRGGAGEEREEEGGEAHGAIQSVNAEGYEGYEGEEGWEG